MHYAIITALHYIVECILYKYVMASYAFNIVFIVSL